jgi:HAE1 family hydrophobic/amphiphilic exporter-1
MASLNVDFGTAMKVLAAINGGTFVNQTSENGQYRQLYVQAEGSERELVQSLNNLYVPAANGYQVPLTNLVTLKLDSAPPIISHYGLYRSVLIQVIEEIGRSSVQAIDTLSATFQQLNFSNIGMAW